MSYKPRKSTADATRDATWPVPPAPAQQFDPHKADRPPEQGAEEELSHGVPDDLPPVDFVRPVTLEQYTLLELHAGRKALAAGRIQTLQETELGKSVLKG